MFSRRQFFRLVGGLGALTVSSTAYGFGVEPARLRVARYNLLPPRWPSDFKLSIAVIADLHACDPWMSLERIHGIVERTNALGADVIVMLCGFFCSAPPTAPRWRRSSPRDAAHPGSRMGAGAGRIEGAARRACDPRQSRLVGRQGRAARRAGADRGPARARTCRHSGLRERCKAPEQGWPPLLARRARRSTGLSAGAAVSAGAAHRR